MDQSFELGTLHNITEQVNCSVFRGGCMALCSLVHHNIFITGYISTLHYLADYIIIIGDTFIFRYLK